MVAEIVWLDQAKEDIQALFDFITSENPKAASKYVGELRETCQRLADFPRSGRRYSDEYRCVVFRNHVVLYRYELKAEQVFIVTVVDGKRDLEHLLNNRR